MFVPLNLSPKEIEHLRLNSTISENEYCIETVNPFGNFPEITYVSPHVSILPETLTNFEKKLQDNETYIEQIQYFYLGYDESQKKQILEEIIQIIKKRGYKIILSILSFIQQLLELEIDDYEWRFIEKIIEICIYIKSPEITFYIEKILTKVLDYRNIVFYISDSQDAHFTMHLDPMDRNFMFIAVDLIVYLYSSPQGYPIPTENVFLLFDSSTYIWYRKPSILPRINTPLEKLTRQDILEFVDSLRFKYADKLFPQYNMNDQKMVYFEIMTKVLNEVKVCDSYFENSTYLWEKGEFIKPLAMQASRRSDWSIEQAFSPFLYDNECSLWISTMPPVIRQKNIYKEYEIRGTYFINYISCVKIDTQKLTGKKAGIDWRYSNGLQENMYEIDLPNYVVSELINCFNVLQLQFCTFDIIFDGKDYYLLDINYNGQWIFSDEKCDMKITRKILNFLGTRSNLKVRSPIS
ncbi:hypothetical protein [Argonema galeatum]|uniref:hypothetical protein n=1 Tax=Argonema galeatum TaxID=2942762 RepID=UPI002013B3ED|nr:hypothetical protein [Argonema galeatum]MCL1466995.1 hypothetical protein [Argonema galeatum A003/A1]